MQLEVDAGQFREMLDGDEVQIVDVREAHELASGGIDGARHLPMNELSEQAQSIARDRPVVFYCSSGSRSLMAAQAFQAAGWEAYSLSGGMKEWDAQ